MLKRGSIILAIWSGINFLLAFLILTSVVIFNADSPLLVMVFEKPEIASLDARVIEALNTLTILYNSCSMVVSVLVWIVIWKNLIAGQKWAFWLLLFVIGFIEVMAFIASAPVGNARWQVNVLQSILYLAGISLSGYAIFTRIVNYAKTKHAKQVRTLFKEIYPEWDETMLDRVVYDEKHPLHIKTRLLFENGILIGQANAFWISRGKRIANIGYHIHPKHQQKGIGYQLTKSLLDDLSNEVNYFIALTTDDNVASQRLCEKLGFADPSNEIRDVVTNTDKYKKTPGPCFRVLAVNERNSKAKNAL